MTVTPVIRIERPQASLDAYLEEDCWTVDRSELLLPGLTGRAPGELLELEIALATGEVVVRASGRVVGDEPAGARPACTRVKLARLDGDSKSVLRRALDARRRREAPPASASSPEASPSPDPGADAPRAAQASGVVERPRAPVNAPAARDELLARLRDRGAYGRRRAG